jgi:hypothetical protein
LKSIAFNFEQINEQLIEEFGLKFGQKLTEITFKTTSNGVEKHKKLLRLCPNIIGFIDGYVTDLSVFVGNNDVLVPKLSKIGLRLNSQDFDYIKNFAKTYGNSLKSVLFEANLGVDDIETNVLMKQIVYLKSLQKLDLMLEFSADSSQEFIENLKSIALNCNQLKQLYFFVAETNPSLDKQIFNCWQYFKNLNLLELSLNKDKEESNEISCQSLKELKLLTHLMLENPKMNDIFFADIDKHLPKLKRLDIIVDNFIITDKAMNSLSKLMNLKSIKIKCPENIFEETEDIMPLITDSGLIDVINNCSEINSIEFKGRPNITHNTIDALIALALRKPRIYFKHRFDDIEEDYQYFSYEDIYFTAIDLKSFEFPNNLIINEL